VQPFASLIDRVPATCPRVLINLERVGEIASYGNPSSGMRGSMNETGFDFQGWTLGKDMGKEHIRDVFYQGKCDEGILELAKRLGWEKELLEKHDKMIEKLQGKMRSPDKEPIKAEEAADKVAEKIAVPVGVEKSGEKEDKDDLADKLANALNIGEKSEEGAARSK
jgi:hypothetical protein